MTRLFPLVVLALAFPGVVQASYTYRVTVDTTGFTEQDIYLDFQFNPLGMPVHPATATVSNFYVSGGTGYWSNLSQTPYSVDGFIEPNRMVITNTYSVNQSLDVISRGDEFGFLLTIDTPVPDPLYGSQFKLGVYGSQTGETDGLLYAHRRWSWGSTDRIVDRRFASDRANVSHAPTGRPRHRRLTQSSPRTGPLDPLGDGGRLLGFRRFFDRSASPLALARCGWITHLLSLRRTTWICNEFRCSANTRAIQKGRRPRWPTWPRRPPFSPSPLWPSSSRAAT